MQRGVDVGAAHRLDEGARDVVVLAARAVVAHRGDRDGLLDVRELDGLGVLARRVAAAGGPGVGGDPGRRLEGGERAAGVPARHPHEVVAGRVGEGEGAVEPPLVLQRRLDDLLVGERGEGDEHRAGQQGRDDGEARVLGRCGDEDDEAVLDTGQEGVLLGLAEAVDLIEEEDGLAAVEVALAGRGLHDLADVLDPGRHGRQLDEAAPGGRRDEVGQRRLARSGRPPDDRRHRPGRAARALDEPAKRTAGPQHLLLAADLLDAARAHPHRERRARVGLVLAVRAAGGAAHSGLLARRGKKVTHPDRLVGSVDRPTAVLGLEPSAKVTPTCTC